MKHTLRWILSLVVLFAAVPTANASDMNLAAMEEVKKKKKKKGKKLSEKGKKKKKGKKIGKKGKKSKKGFFSKVFGSK